ncbi:MAG: PAS domain-containing sensor histidine kinase [Bacteroidota bacterium]
MNANPSASSEDARRLQAIWETAIDGIITINRRGRIESINPAAARLFGYSAEEVQGQNINMLMPEPYHSEHDEYMEHYQATGRKKIIGIGREVRGKRKDGDVFPLYLSVAEVQLEGKTIYTGIVHDLSEQKRIESQIRELNQSLERIVQKRTEELSETVNQLLRTNQQLEHEVTERKRAENALRQSERETRQALEKEKELSELKSRFVSMASHEFRTPLSTILSSAALVGRYPSSDQQDKRQKHIDRIKTAVGLLTDILNDFLSLSKLEEGKLAQQAERFSADGFNREVIEEMRGLLRPGQQIVYQPPPSDLEVHLDPRLLKHILFNLLSNASKYSADHQSIYYRCTPEEKLLRFEVRDEGMGIPQRDQEHLFGRFFRATNVSNIQGTGLGLHIVRGYVEMMGGKITFRSTEGQGSVFIVQLPIDQTP